MLMEPKQATLKVAYDHEIFATQRYGGVSRYFAELIARGTAHGISPRVFAPLHVNQHLDEIAPLAGGQILKLNLFSGLLARRVDEQVAPRRMAHWQPAVVHETWLPRRPSVIPGAATVVTIHDMIHELYDLAARGDPTASLKTEAIQRAHRVICVSESTRRDLLRLHPLAEAKTRVVHHGFTAARPDPDAPCSTSPPYLLFVGKRAGYKNFARLLEAFALGAARRGFMLLCVGGGPFVSAERSSIVRLGLSGSVIQEEASDALLATRYRNAAAFVFPSEYEGFGFPPLEAMAAGCPTIVARASAIPEICGNASAYFDPREIGDLSSAIDEVISSPARVEALRQAGFARLPHFSWERCVHETAAVYREAAGA